jgi:hypothetical protein
MVSAFRHIEAINRIKNTNRKKKMFNIEQPAMALNAVDDPPPATMWNTWDIYPTYSREHIINWTAKVAGGAPGGKLKSVVICCHAKPGDLRLGEGFDRRHTYLFARWAGLVEVIYLRGCAIAYIKTPGAKTVGDGNLFCSEIAKYAKCYVVASTEKQWTLPVNNLPPGQLDMTVGYV